MSVAPSAELDPTAATLLAERHLPAAKGDDDDNEFGDVDEAAMLFLDGGDTQAFEDDDDFSAPAVGEVGFVSSYQYPSQPWYYDYNVGSSMLLGPEHIEVSQSLDEDLSHQI
ncbi:uncharacterized protein RCC_10341 [Ramularia collo-cygni]|uniref:Uncharacterized protein n=1 Tax=Ramularia collo-cygni TaxID=112498 RepID=A0A2D3V5H5_9PEZI|nr:uncharacterized protein RCC_10341 [Ramularia collo-cygni]CZT24616.1 uncharacterized protein RCC_10341 [Ramularia collo-cygni]